MSAQLTPRKIARYRPVQGPLGDVGLIFRRLGGLSRLDVVFAMLSIACVAFWRCLRSGRRRATRASMQRIRLLTYTPSEKLSNTA